MSIASDQAQRRTLSYTTSNTMLDPNDPSVPSPEYVAMCKQTELPRALMGGTSAMQTDASKYLPKHPAEKQEHWDERKKKSVLRNYFKRAVTSIKGKVFANAVVADGTFNAALYAALWDNVDLAGRDVTAFASDTFENAVVDGLSYIMVDMPEGEKNADGTPKPTTLEDDKKANRRPYFIEFPMHRVIGVWWGFRNNALTILQARLLRTTTEYTGYSEIKHQEVLVLEPGKFAVFRKDNSDGKFKLLKEGTMSIPVVPLVPVYTGYRKPFFAEPPLEDLAYLNLEHFQIRSDQRNALNVASFPVLTISGWKTEDGAIEFGPNKALKASDPNAKFAYLESGGAHLSAGRTELQDLEKEMRQYGAQLEVPTEGAETATGRALDASEALSPLQAWAMGTGRALEEAFKLAALWMKISDPVVTLKIEVTPSLIGTRDVDLRTLDSMRARGDLSRPAYVKELQRRAVLSEDYDAEEDQELLDNESLGGGGTGEPEDLGGGQQTEDKQPGVPQS